MVPFPRRNYLLFFDVFLQKVKVVLYPCDLPRDLLPYIVKYKYQASIKVADKRCLNGDNIK